MKLLERITIEPGKCGGKPCIRGKRIRVSDILDLLSHGASHEEVLEDYPFLEPEDILAAIAYASRMTRHSSNQVKYLVVNQLPGALARFLTDRGHPSAHALDLKMDESKDVRIWNHITKNG